MNCETVIDPCATVGEGDRAHWRAQGRRVARFYDAAQRRERARVKRDRNHVGDGQGNAQLTRLVARERPLISTNAQKTRKSEIDQVQKGVRMWMGISHVGNVQGSWRTRSPRKEPSSPAPPGSAAAAAPRCPPGRNREAGGEKEERGKGGGGRGRVIWGENWKRYVSIELCAHL